MQPKPWQAEQSVSPELAIQLIQTQFPALAPVTLEFLGEGWDNIAYRANQKFVFRFPRRQIAVDLIELESSVLPQIADKLPLPIPSPIFLGKPSGEYAWPFSGYEILPGQTACRARLSREERYELAKPLAQFLKALHAIKTGAPDDKMGRLDVETRWPKTHQNLTQIAQLGLLADTKPLFDLLDSLQNIRDPGQQKVLCHGDLYARHLLINSERKLGGVIDWGDVHVGNPAVDLAVIFSFLPPEAKFIFLETYGPIDANTERLALFRALFSASVLALYAHDTNDQDLLDEAITALGFLIKPPKSVLPYDPNWPKEFEHEAKKLKTVFGDQFIEIHHFGSTAVPGLAAKPIIDILLVLPDIKLADQKIKEMRELGYLPLGSYVHSRHRIFQIRRKFHVHVFEAGDPEIAYNLAFRDTLRQNPAEAAYYAQLKADLAERYPYDSRAYRDGKDLYVKLLKYQPTDSHELAYKIRMLELFKTNPNCFERSLEDAHFTGSCWLLDKTGEKALLLHHKKLNNWFQLGGHADGDPNLLRVAIKEAQEESGIQNIIAVQNGIFDIDIHRVPGHEHYDVRFLLQVASDEQAQQNHESNELRWIGKDLKELPTQSESVVRMFRKWTHS